MRLLVLGGTQFVGRRFVEAALEAGDEVTLLHRGRTNPDLFGEAEHVLGDRESDLGRLDGRGFDAVYDSSGIRPGLVAGAYDPTERFEHWVRARALGGRFEAPAPPDRPVQLIDARDLA